MISPAHSCGEARTAAWMLVPLLSLVSLLTACGGPRGIPVEGRVTRQDGRPVAGGEVWLEPEGDHAASLRPVRRPIEQGHFQFPASDGVLPGRWTIRVYPPSLGSGSSEAEAASLFEPRHESIVLEPAGEPASISLEFTVGPLKSAAD